MKIKIAGTCLRNGELRCLSCNPVDATESYSPMGPPPYRIYADSVPHAYEPCDLCGETLNEGVR